MPLVFINEAVGLLQQGQVIAYPTEAVWGLGCNPFNESAVQQLLTLKQRPPEKGLILVVANAVQALPYLTGLTDAQQQAVLTPPSQPTTWLVPLTEQVPLWISGQFDRVALRISAHPVIQALCLNVGHALVSTSANPSGQPAARTVQQVQAYFPDLPFLVGQLGQATRPSQIVDAITGAIVRA